MGKSRAGSLVAKVTQELRSSIASGDFAAGSKLPPENELSARFEVSRPTVRAAIRELAVLGLVQTTHGVGTFVVDKPTVRTGLERLSSITESIRATGRNPEVVFASRLIREVLPEEADRMDVPGDTSVLEIRRTILADGEVLAYSYDLVPASLLPEEFDVDDVDGSLFHFARETLNRAPTTAVAELHAVESGYVGWGPGATSHRLFLLLSQMHRDSSGELVLYSRTYFIEGRYAFFVVRSI
ncbi:GntR family transcriptional regulator [Microbacterium sp. W4I4]|uniref:GntR family transcriptional regulator n=1 Tax=Microbacterium sp. W4I4 TaxID=3042295 RepID=UPI0027881501|nr:GntR family transcriptional regulator [Microbacterium sp. W4I4]MDQ0614071.1 GntR family transcriptional regulator [Microbacterium sp. W4I4]